MGLSEWWSEAEPRFAASVGVVKVAGTYRLGTERGEDQKRAGSQLRGGSFKQWNYASADSEGPTPD